AVAAAKGLQQAAAAAHRREAPPVAQDGAGVLVLVRTLPGVRLCLRSLGGQRDQSAEFVGARVCLSAVYCQLSHDQLEVLLLARTRRQSCARCSLRSLASRSRRQSLPP